MSILARRRDHAETQLLAAPELLPQFAILATRPSSRFRTPDTIAADTRTAAPVPRGWPFVVRSSALRELRHRCLARGEALAPLELGLGRLLEVHLPDLDLT